MRNFFVKYFALSYYFKAFGKYRTVARAAIPVIIGFILMCLIVGLDSDYPTFSGDDWLGLFLFLYPIYISFVYLRTDPVKWEELDKTQKFLYGKMKNSNLTVDQVIEWQKLKKEMNSKGIF